MKLLLHVEIPAAALAGEPVFRLSSAAHARQGVTIVLPEGFKVDVDLTKVEYVDDPFLIGGAPE